MNLDITDGRSGVRDSSYLCNALSDVSLDWFKLDVIAAPTNTPRPVWKYSAMSLHR